MSRALPFFLYFLISSTQTAQLHISTCRGNKFKEHLEIKIRLCSNQQIGYANQAATTEGKEKETQKNKKKKRETNPTPNKIVIQ